MKCWKHVELSVCPCDVVYETEAEEYLDRANELLHYALGVLRPTWCNRDKELVAEIQQFFNQIADYIEENE